MATLKKARRAKSRKPVPNLPPLKLAIYQNGVLSHVTELPDPRNGFISQFNREWGGGKLRFEARLLEGGDA